MFGGLFSLFNGGAQQPMRQASTLPPNPSRGQIAVGEDGLDYQYIQRNGDIGGNGDWGWSRVNQGGGMSSLLDNPLFMIGASMAEAGGPSLTPVSPFAGLGTGLSNAYKMKEAKEGKAQAAATKNQTVEFLRKTRPDLAQAVEAGSYLPKEALDIYYQDQRQERQGASQTRRSLAPIYGTDAQGNPVLLQVGDDGTATQTQVPDGVTISTGVDRVDAGTHWVLMDKRSGQMLGTLPKDVAGVEEEKVRGRTAGENAASANSDAQGAANALRLIDNIRNDPYRQRGTGFSSIGNNIPGTGGYDFQKKVDEATSGAFLTAIQQLRGMGALSNAEGQTATRAVTRLNTAMSEEGFLEALADYERIVLQGYERAARYGANVPLPEQDAPVQSGGGQRLRFNPETGELE